MERLEDAFVCSATLPVKTSSGATSSNVAKSIRNAYSQSKGQRRCLKSRHGNSQVVQHVGHVAAVIEGVSVRLFSLVHLPLALEDISQVTPCCLVSKEKK